MKADKPRRTILVVDDEPAIRELLRAQLAAEGYDVVMADDAPGAARQVRDAKPDLMIVDAHMPYVGGLDFVSAVITDSSMPWVPVIFISGRSELRSNAESLGAASLVKPFLAARLTELVERVLHAQERLYAVAGTGDSADVRKALGAA
jgi:DNA-binding response OmpR family regulator